MVHLTGERGANNYTMGAALVYEGRSSLDLIWKASEAVVVVARSVKFRDLLSLDLRYIRGFVFEEPRQDDELAGFLWRERRATVFGVESVLEQVSPGQTVIVDGVSGEVFLSPDEETIARYDELRRRGPPPLTDSLEELVARARAMVPGMKPESEAATVISIIEGLSERTLAPNEEQKVHEVLNPPEPPEAEKRPARGRPARPAASRRDSHAHAAEEEGAAAGHAHDVPDEGASQWPRIPHFPDRGGEPATAGAREKARAREKAE